MKMELIGSVARSVVGCEKRRGVKIDPKDLLSTEMGKTVVGVWRVELGAQFWTTEFEIL